MHRSARATRTLAPLATVFLLVSLSGCHWFSKTNDAYLQSAESRPLEIPPDLDRPAADRAMNLPATTATTATASAATPTMAPLGFNLAVDRDTAFAKVGEALAAV
ncbi:MAG: hypothetical protein K8F33_04715, partial [Thermomonas sp.]|nr:hypothetical protein [Thermomonas sp.]